MPEIRSDTENQEKMRLSILESTGNSGLCVDLIEQV